MTSPLKVKLSHRHDKVHSQRGRNRGVKGERRVEITNWCWQMVEGWFQRHKIVTEINTNAVPPEI